MTLPASGAISLSQVNVELGVSATATRSLNDATTRTLFGVPSGQISMSQGYGKANEFILTISSNQTNANLRTLAVNAGWNQSSRVFATINSGVYVSSSSTGVPGLTVNGAFPGGVQLINNGFIIGMGGAGGAGGGGGSNLPGVAGGGGGLALSVGVAIQINNAGTIGGGGGGGGGGEYRDDSGVSGGLLGGGGGGGGRTGAAANSSGGAGGVSLGSGNTHGTAGGAGTVSAAGAGGVGGVGIYGGQGASGGGGGVWGAAGTIGGLTGTGTGRGAGGAAGAAVSGNGNITWLATGTRLGAIS